MIRIYFVVAEGHLYISERVCTYVCRGMLVSTQSNLVANYSNSHHPRPNSKIARFFGSNEPKTVGRAGGGAKTNSHFGVRAWVVRVRLARY